MKQKAFSEQATSGYLYVNRAQGITICFSDPFTDRGQCVFFGPKIDWPFYDGSHRFLLSFEAAWPKTRYHPSSPTEAPAGHPRGIQWLDLFEIDGKEGLQCLANASIWQCASRRYVVFGPQANYVMQYPDCGQTEQFHHEAKASIHHTIRQMTFLSPPDHEKYEPASVQER